MRSKKVLKKCSKSAQSRQFQGNRLRNPNGQNYAILTFLFSRVPLLITFYILKGFIFVKTKANQKALTRLALFHEKITNMRRQAGYLQKDLATALGLDAHVLSRKLHGSGTAVLSHQDTKQIIMVLAAWDAITTRAEAGELLALMGLKLESFSAEEWNSEPLNRLSGPVFSTDISTTTLETLPALLPGQMGTAFPEPSIPLARHEKDVQQVYEQLQQGKARLLTLLATDGVDKARLSIEMAREIQKNFADSVSSFLSQPLLIALWPRP